MTLVRLWWMGCGLGWQGHDSSSRPRETASCVLGAVLVLRPGRAPPAVHTAFSASVSLSLGDIHASDEESSLVDFGVCTMQYVLNVTKHICDRSPSKTVTFENSQLEGRSHSSHRHLPMKWIRACCYSVFKLGTHSTVHLQIKLNSLGVAMFSENKQPNKEAMLHLSRRILRTQS